MESIEKFKEMLEGESRSRYIEKQFIFLSKITSIFKRVCDSMNPEEFLEASAEFLEISRSENEIFDNNKRSSISNELRRLILNNNAKKGYDSPRFELLVVKEQRTVRYQRTIILRNILFLCAERICVF